MKFIVFLVIVFSLFSCSEKNEKVKIEKGRISLMVNEVFLENLTPYINSKKLNFESAETVPEKTITHFTDEKNNSYSLIFRETVVEGATFFTVSFRPEDLTRWKGNDTLKVLMKKTSEIENGMYSKLYSPVYAWCKPVNFGNISQVDTVRGVQFACCRFTTGTYTAFLPMGGEGFVFTLGKDKNGFGSVGFTQFEKEVANEVPVLAIGFSNDFYQLVPGIYNQAFGQMGTTANLRRNKKKPDMYNYLGWASWNAYKHDISEEKIISAAKSLNQAQVPVKWFLIDDGWLDISGNKLNSFVPDKSKFPNGFKNLTSTLRNDYGLRDIGVWHTLNGYWKGLNEKGALLESYSDTMAYYDQIVWLDKQPEKMYFLEPQGNDAKHFYEDWYGYLKSEGISFVKVDNQLVLQELSDGNYPLWETGELFFDYLHSAVNKNFNGKIINCMDMTNADYFHYAKTAVARTSEDYNPDSKKDSYELGFTGNAASHVLMSVHNSVWLQQMVWPDYDMFQSVDEEAWFYAIAKVMSSGPVYLTDEPGKHNEKLLHSITFQDGKVISADNPALPTKDCMFQLFDLEQPFKVFSTFGDCGLLAAWNVSDLDKVTGSFTPEQIRGLTGTDFVVFDFFGKSVTRISSDSEIPVSLPRLKSNLYTVIPVKQNIAVIGNADKVIPVAGITDKKITENSVSFKTVDEGTFQVYSKISPARIAMNGQSIEEFNYENNIISFQTKANSLVKLNF